MNGTWCTELPAGLSGRTAFGTLPPSWMRVRVLLCRLDLAFPVTIETQPVLFQQCSEEGLFKSGTVGVAAAQTLLRTAQNSGPSAPKVRWDATQARATRWWGNPRNLENSPREKSQIWRLALRQQMAKTSHRRMGALHSRAEVFSSRVGPDPLFILGTVFGLWNLRQTQSWEAPNTRRREKSLPSAGSLLRLCSLELWGILFSLAVYGEDKRSLHVSWDLSTASADGQARMFCSHVLLSCDCPGTPSCLTFRTLLNVHRAVWGSVCSLSLLSLQELAQEPTSPAGSFLFGWLHTVGDE